MMGAGHLREKKRKRRYAQLPVDWRSTQGVEGRQASDAVVAQCSDGVNNAEGGHRLTRRLRPQQPAAGSFAGSRRLGTEEFTVARMALS